MKKNLVIRSGTLRIGGLERVLVEVLQNIDYNKYNISLIIEDDSGDKNVFLDQIPKNIDLYFLKSNFMLERTDYHRKRKKKILNKIIYNFLMSNERKFVLKKTKEVLEKIKNKIGDIDVFLDYDWGARRYAEKIDVKRKIIWMHNHIPQLVKTKTRIKRFGKDLDKYDTVVAICDDMKEGIEKLYPYLKEKNKVKKVYNPFNFKRILDLSTDISKLTEKEKELIKDDYIVAVSRLDIVQKDYRTLLKGYHLAVEEGIKEKLYIVGDGPSRDEIEKLIKEENLDDKVVLIGQTTNPYIWMKNSKLFVHSSNYEGFGLVIVEASILGKASIVSDCPVGPNEILANGKYGKLFPMKDYKTLKRELITLLTGDDEREKFEVLANERAKDFEVEKIMREYDSIILDKNI